MISIDDDSKILLFLHITNMINLFQKNEDFKQKSVSLTLNFAPFLIKTIKLKLLDQRINNYTLQFALKYWFYGREFNHWNRNNHFKLHFNVQLKCRTCNK